jgi:hypothetical protein
MKKIILTLITIFTISLGYSQESKAYLGVSLGVAIPGGDIADDLETGIDLGFINFGYRFSENWGAILNLVSSGHTVKDADDGVVGIAYFGLGPMYTTSISDNISWDIKPQIALGLTGVSVQDGYDDMTSKGNGFVLGNSLVFGTEKGFKFSINLDYLTGKFTEYNDGVDTYDIDDDNGFNKLSLGVGVRYNF